MRKGWLFLALACFLLPLVSGGGMIVFAAFMARAKKQWMEVGVRVSEMQSLGLDLADFLGQFWPFLVGAMLLIGWPLAILFAIKAFRSKEGWQQPQEG